MTKLCAYVLGIKETVLQTLSKTSQTRDSSAMY